MLVVLLLELLEDFSAITLILHCGLHGQGVLDRLRRVIELGERGCDIHICTWSCLLRRLMLTCWFSACSYHLLRVAQVVDDIIRTDEIVVDSCLGLCHGLPRAILLSHNRSTDFERTFVFFVGHARSWN